MDTEKEDGVINQGWLAGDVGGCIPQVGQRDKGTKEPPHTGIVSRTMEMKQGNSSSAVFIQGRHIILNQISEMPVHAKAMCRIYYYAHPGTPFDNTEECHASAIPLLKVAASEKGFQQITATLRHST